MIAVGLLYPRYYENIGGGTEWARLAPVCCDLDRDGHPDRLLERSLRASMLAMVTRIDSA